MKKIATIIPLSCALVVGAGVAPSASSVASAAEMPVSKPATTKPSNNQNQLKEDLKYNFLRAASILDHKNINYYAMTEDYNNIKFDLKYNDTNAQISTNAVANSYMDGASVELLTYKNESNRDQTAYTPEKSVKVTESFTYSNAEGVKLGLSSQTKIGLSIPFVAEGGETITASSEFTYNHTSSNTTTNEITETFKSQPIIAQAGQITTYIGIVQNANFSGTFTGKAGVTGTVGMYIKDPDSGDRIYKELTPYQIFKYGSISPTHKDVWSLDDDNQQVILDGMSFSYNGVGGHYSRMAVKIKPIDGKGPTQIMPYAEYMAKMKKK